MKITCKINRDFPCQMGYSVLKIKMLQIFKENARTESGTWSDQNMAKQYWRPGKYAVSGTGSDGELSDGRDEKPNIITIAWAGTVCSSPAMVSISVRKERYSHDILKRDPVSL